MIFLLKKDGTAACWGLNDAGQIGHGQLGNYKTSPTPVKNLNNAKAIVTDGHHNCALGKDGNVRCWGENLFGQLGNGEEGSKKNKSAPVAVLDLKDAVAIIAGWYHNCALKNDGAMVCWGFNASGQLGDGTTTNQAKPVAVKGL